MKNKVSITIIVCFFFLSFVRNALCCSSDKVLYIFNWAQYIDPQVIKDFEKEYNVHVQYDVFDNNHILETKLMVTDRGYDLVFPSSSPFLVNQIRLGVYQKIDKTKLKNYSNLNPYFEGLLKTTNSEEYAIPYLWGTMGIGYNKQILAKIFPGEGIDSLKFVFDPSYLSKLAHCGVEILDVPTEVIPLILHYLGYDKNEITDKSMVEVEQVLKNIRPFISNINQNIYINNLASGETCLALGYSGDVIQAKNASRVANNGVIIGYNVPTEGSEIWMDVMAIPKKSQNTELAYKFIDFLLKPENIAKVSNYISYPNTNLYAKEYLNVELQEDKLMFLDEKLTNKLYYATIFSPEQKRKISTIWLRFLKNSYSK
jgi:putrescine transport system substrate-binding protein